MSAFIIEGGRPLKGEITPQGAKNEALQILCATLLTSEPIRISNLPDIADVNNQIRLLQDIGVRVTRHAQGDMTFQADNVDISYLQSEEFLERCSRLRGSVMLVGPLVARFGHAFVSKPGGDKIGRRRLDTHFLGIQKLGADFTYDAERCVFEIRAEHLKGTYMLLEEAGRKRGYLLARGEINTERMAKVLVDEYRSGKLGRITFEEPPEENNG